jgi:hypothetical protein
VPTTRPQRSSLRRQSLTPQCSPPRCGASSAPRSARRFRTLTDSARAAAAALEMGKTKANQIQARLVAKLGLILRGVDPELRSAVLIRSAPHSRRHGAFRRALRLSVTRGICHHSCTSPRILTTREVRSLRHQSAASLILAGM